ncbi:MAG: hypothetical protein J6R18_00630 [Kiritimatiellae bacterium]|nr:hypothetical protein [Kiritimatiellia bacterium]
MRKQLTLIVALVATVLFAEMPRSEWHPQVGDCARNPAKLRAVMTQISKADKVAFLKEVNEAISKMPGSPEVAAARFLRANRAALASSGPESRLDVLAEIFATVPPESLTTIIEELSKNELAPSQNISKNRYLAIVRHAMDVIARRCESSEAGGIRAAMAGAMFVKAANSDAQSDTADAVSRSLPSDIRKVARSQWIPAAAGMNQAQSYDPILAAAQAGEEPMHLEVISIYPQQITDSMLADLQAGVLPGEHSSAASLDAHHLDFFHGDVDAMHVKMPTPSKTRVQIPVLPGALVTGRPEDNDELVKNPEHTSGRDYADKGEPKPYRWQNP